MTGRGACLFTIDFGDGNRQEVKGEFPQRINHTYALVDTYTVIVAPVAPCVGKFTERLQIAARGGERITGLTIDPPVAEVRRTVTITVEGVGTCGYRINYGDGNHEDRVKPLPDRLTHVYNARRLLHHRRRGQRHVRRPHPAHPRRAVRSGARLPASGQLRPLRGQVAIAAVRDTWHRGPDIRRPGPESQRSVRSPAKSLTASE